MATNPLSLSDEDFLNETAPPSASSEGESPSQGNQEDNSSTEQKPVQEKPVETPNNQESTKEPEKTPAEGGTAAEPAKTEAEPDPEKEQTPAEKAAAAALADGATQAKPGEPDAASSGSSAEGAKPQTEAEKKPGSEAPANGTQTPPDYEGFYKQVMTPFTANGKKIELKDPAEAVQLMQMGANYTRKMQEMAPHRKVLTMLGNHNLLDESKLSFFIALDKGDPEAIKKLIVDKGVDPLDIDTKIEPAYQEGSYQVSDQEVAFRTQLDDLVSTDVGKQTLQAIQTDWDQASRDMLWQHPEVMPIIQQQRENGVYARITGEMDRRRTLGQILPTTPFLEAYQAIGNELHGSGAFAQTGGQADQQGQGAEAKPGQADPANKDGGQGSSASAVEAKPVTQTPQTPAVVAAGRAAAPKPLVDNGDKAGAASATRTTPAQAKAAVNFLSMSDDDFLKASDLQGRV